MSDSDERGVHRHEVLSLFVSDDEKSFEGFDSSDLRESQNRLREQMKTYSRSNKPHALGSENQIQNEPVNEPSNITSKGKQNKQKGKGKKRKSEETPANIAPTDIANAFTSMNEDQIDSFKEMMGINDLFSCVYDLANPSKKTKASKGGNSQPSQDNNNPVENPKTSESHDASQGSEDDLEDKNQNYFEYFDDHDDDKEIRLDDWELPDWFVSDKKGKDIDQKLADMVNTICTSEGDTSKIIENLHRPANCTYLKAPKVNPDIWNLLSKSAQTRDYGFQAVQKAITSGMIPIIRAAEACKSIFDKNHDVRKFLKEALIVLGNSVYLLSQKRRFLMRKQIHTKFSDLCNASQPISDMLFGPDVQKKMKELSELDKCKKGNRQYGQPMYNYNRPNRRFQGYYNRGGYSRGRFLGQGQMRGQNQRGRRAPRY